MASSSDVRARLGWRREDTEEQRRGEASAGVTITETIMEMSTTTTSFTGFNTCSLMRTGRSWPGSAAPRGVRTLSSNAREKQRTERSGGTRPTKGRRKAVA